jgi:hypothetical protein
VVCMLVLTAVSLLQACFLLDWICCDSWLAEGLSAWILEPWMR